MEAELFHADRRTDMTKLTVAFRNFANAPRTTLFPSPSCYWLPLTFQFSCYHPTPTFTGVSLCCLFKTRDQVSQPFKTRGKLMVLQCTFRLLYRRWEAKGFWSHQCEALLAFKLFMKSSLQWMWFVNAMYSSGTWVVFPRSTLP